MKIQKKLQNAIISRIAAVKRIKKKDVLQFAKDCVPTVICLGIYMIPHAVGASTSSQADSVGITPLQKPLKIITDALTGPIPILVTGGGIALGGMSWAMGWEQQAMMRGVKVAGGGAVAMGAGQFLESTIADGGQTLTSGVLF